MLITVNHLARKGFFLTGAILASQSCGKPHICGYLPKQNNKNVATGYIPANNTETKDAKAS